MSKTFDELLPLFWERPEYTNAWRLCLEDDATRRAVMKDVLKKLPESWGDLDFIEEHPSDAFIVLFTHDIDSDAARKNELRILSVLAATGALSFFGTEGCSGEIDIARFRAFPHQQSISSVAEYLFRTRKISPLVAVMLLSPTPLYVWGIEDPELYDKARKQLIGGSGDYWETIDVRTSVLLDNLLLKIRERGELFAGSTITEYNYHSLHEMLSAKCIAHAGVTARSEGDADFGRTIEEMRKADESPGPLEQLFRGEDNTDKQARIYRSWKRRRNDIAPEHEVSLQHVAGVTGYSMDAIRLVFDVIAETQSGEASEPSHLSGQQLCWLLRDLTVDFFGNNAREELSNLGIASTKDFGKIIHSMIDIGLVGARPTDSLSDFNDVYDFNTVFPRPDTVELDELETVHELRPTLLQRTAAAGRVWLDSCRNLLRHNIKFTPSGNPLPQKAIGFSTVGRRNVCETLGSRTQDIGVTLLSRSVTKRLVGALWRLRIFVAVTNSTNDTITLTRLRGQLYFQRIGAVLTEDSELLTHTGPVEVPGNCKIELEFVLELRDETPRQTEPGFPAGERMPMKVEHLQYHHFAAVFGLLLDYETTNSGRKCAKTAASDSLVCVQDVDDAYLTLLNKRTIPLLKGKRWWQPSFRSFLREVSIVLERHLHCG